MSRKPSGYSLEYAAVVRVSAGPGVAPSGDVLPKHAGTSSTRSDKIVRRLFCHLLLGADLCLIAIFLAAYAARFVHPRYAWWLQLVAIGLPVLNVLVVLGGVVAAWRWRPWLLLLHVLCTLLIAVRLVPLRTAKAGGTTRAELTVLSYNVHRLSSAGAQQRFTRLIQRLSPDLVGLQETRIHYVDEPQVVALEPQARIVMSTRRYQMPLPESPAERRATQQPIFSALPLARPVLQAWQVGAGRPMVTRAQVRWEGRDVAVYNVHLRSFNPTQEPGEASFEGTRLRSWVERISGYRKDLLLRAAEAEKLRQLLESEQLPFIVLGDFNSTPDQWVYAHVVRGYQDAHRRAGGMMGQTYHARWPLLRIDYVIASPEWHVHAAQTIRIDVSDHRPVVARLSLPTQ